MGLIKKAFEKAPLRIAILSVVQGILIGLYVAVAGNHVAIYMLAVFWIILGSLSYAVNSLYVESKWAKIAQGLIIIFASLSIAITLNLSPSLRAVHSTFDEMMIGVLIFFAIALLPAVILGNWLGGALKKTTTRKAHKYILVSIILLSTNLVALAYWYFSSAGTHQVVQERYMIRVFGLIIPVIILITSWAIHLMSKEIESRKQRIRSGFTIALFIYEFELIIIYLFSSIYFDNEGAAFLFLFYPIAVLGLALLALINTVAVVNTALYLSRD